MKKFIATSIAHVDEYPLDCFSLSHLNSGIIAYYIGFWLLQFFLIPLSACHIALVCILIGSIIWEITENTALVNMKKNKRPDSSINSQTDTLLVFLGGIIGLITYNSYWIFKIIIIGSLFLSYAITRILTEKNSKNIKKSKKDKKSSKKPKNED